MIPDDVKRSMLIGYVSILEAADSRPLGPYKLITIAQAIEMAKAYESAKRKYCPGFEFYDKSDLCLWDQFFEEYQE